MDAIACDNGKISPIKYFPLNVSLGNTYGAITEICGFTMNDGEGKTMTLAPMAENESKTDQIIINKNRDIRSYRQDSSRLLKSGFKPKYNVDFAIGELINFFQTKSKFNFTNKNFNLLRMKELNIK